MIPVTDGCCTCGPDADVIDVVVGINRNSITLRFVSPSCANGFGVIFIRLLVPFIGCEDF